MDFGTDLLICRSKEAAQQVCMKQTDHENDEVGPPIQQTPIQNNSIIVGEDSWVTTSGAKFNVGFSKRVDKK